MKTQKITKTVLSNGTIEYRNEKGEYHRLDGPAVESLDGYKVWCQHGQRHRLDGPAVEYSNGGKRWYQHGKLHRLDGPAIEEVDGFKEWWVEGVQLVKEDSFKPKWDEDALNWMIGKECTKAYRNEDELYFEFAKEGKRGLRIRQCHIQDCCESVCIEDICGDLENFVGLVVQAEKVSSEKDNSGGVSETWTFYKFATNSEYLTVRWYGTSNGYYSESVDTILEEM